VYQPLVTAAARFGGSGYVVLVERLLVVCPCDVVALDLLEVVGVKFCPDLVQDQVKIV
jgi:hypothetical protein